MSNHDGRNLIKWSMIFSAAAIAIALIVGVVARVSIDTEKDHRVDALIVEAKRRDKQIRSERREAIRRECYQSQTATSNAIRVTVGYRSVAVEGASPDLIKQIETSNLLRAQRAAQAIEEVAKTLDCENAGKTPVEAPPTTTTSRPGPTPTAPGAP